MTEESMTLETPEQEAAFAAVLSEEGCNAVREAVRELYSDLDLWDAVQTREQTGKDIARELVDALGRLAAPPSDVHPDDAVFARAVLDGMAERLRGDSDRSA